jgi:hypothetical protein
MIISRDADFLSQANMYLCRMNADIRVITLSDPSKIEETLEASLPVDGFVCDHNPPKTDAFEIFQARVKKKDFRPFIITTSKEDETIISRAYEQKIDYVVVRDRPIMNLYLDFTSKIVVAVEAWRIKREREVNERRLKALVRVASMHNFSFHEILFYVLEEFVAFGKQEIIDKLASELLKELFFEETGTFEPDTIGKDLMTKAIKGRFGLDYSCRITLNKPIIGIGAPVAAYYPQVAEKFDCELILPKYAEVGNAVGAITGSIVESMDILIRPKPGENAVNDPKCFLFAPFGRMEFETVTEAVDYAEKKASEILLDMVISEGAENPKLEMERIDRKYEFGSGYGADALLETHVKVSAVGKPKQFRPMEKTSYYSDLKQAWDV